MSENNNNDGFFVVVCVFLLVFGSLPLWVNTPEPESTTTVEEVQDDAMFIAVHPYFGRWIDYNGTVSIVVAGRNESGACIDSWFLTSYRYKLGTSYMVYINDTLVAEDWIPLVADFATWRGASWWGYVGETVEVCHVNLTLFEMV